MNEWTSEKKNDSSQMKEDRLKVYLDLFFLLSCAQLSVECGGVF